jgi:hypothetical protein
LPDVKAAFARYTLLKLYTDTVPLNYYPLDQLGTLTIDRQEEDAQANKKFQVDRFNTAELPLYVVIEPTDAGFREIARYSVGIIRDKEELLRFLRENAGSP